MDLLTLAYLYLLTGVVLGVITLVVCGRTPSKTGTPLAEALMVSAAFIWLSSLLWPVVCPAMAFRSARRRTAATNPAR